MSLRGGKRRAAAQRRATEGRERPRRVRRQGAAVGRAADRATGRRDLAGCAWLRSEAQPWDAPSLCGVALPAAVVVVLVHHVESRGRAARPVHVGFPRQARKGHRGAKRGAPSASRALSAPRNMCPCASAHARTLLKEGATLHVHSLTLSPATCGPTCVQQGCVF